MCKLGYLIFLNELLTMRVVIHEANLVTGSSAENSKDTEIFPTYTNPLYTAGPYGPLSVKSWFSISFMGGNSCSNSLSVKFWIGHR